LDCFEIDLRALSPKLVQLVEPLLDVCVLAPAAGGETVEVQ
jgi:hypothetical protein